MSKVHVNFTIDRDVHLWLCTQDFETSKSGLVNSYLRSLMLSVVEPDKDIVDLEKELSLIEKKTTKVLTRKAILEQEIIKKRYEANKKLSLRQEKDFYSFGDAKEKEWWFETINKLLANPSLKEGRYRYYNNVYKACDINKWNKKLEKAKKLKEKENDEKE